MLVKITPDIEQIRALIKAALNDLETLDDHPPTMIAAVKGDLHLLLDYLTAVESAEQLLTVFRNADSHETGLNIKGFISECNVCD